MRSDSAVYYTQNVRRSPGELAEALWKAVNEDNIQKVKDLLEKGADSNNKVYWSEAWLSKNNEPSLKRAPPLHVACWKGNLEIVKALVASGADKDLGDSNNMSPLHYVAEGAHIVVAKYMVEEASCNVGRHISYTIRCLCIEPLPL